MQIYMFYIYVLCVYKMYVNTYYKWYVLYVYIFHIYLFYICTYTYEWQGFDASERLSNILFMYLKIAFFL